MRFALHDVLNTWIFKRDGRKYRADIVRDDTSREPWSDECGHGPVSEWSTRDKRPGERVLSRDRNSFRYYDFAEAVAIARHDGWDTAPYGQGTPGQRAERAAEADFQRLRAWCNDEWCYVGVAVTLLTRAGRDSDQWESFWGIESDDPDYHREVAEELADQLAHGVAERRKRSVTIAPVRLRRLARGARIAQAV